MLSWHENPFLFPPTHSLSQRKGRHPFFPQYSEACGSKSGLSLPTHQVSSEPCRVGSQKPTVIKIPRFSVFRGGGSSA